MYCPAHFEETRVESLLELIEHFPLATIVSSGEMGLVADHIPLMFEPCNGATGKLVGHVAKNNPLWQAPPNQEHLLIFQGPSSYISPNWYASKANGGKVVPTWNYVALHVSATLKAFHEPEAILALLNKLTDRHEATQPHPWHVTDAPADYTEQLLGKIVGIEFSVVRMLGKWKVSQNQPASNQSTVIAGLELQQSDVASQMASLVMKFAKGG